MVTEQKILELIADLNRKSESHYREQMRPECTNREYHAGKSGAYASVVAALSAILDGESYGHALD